MDKSSEQKQTLYNIIASALVGGINFFTAPVFTRLLGAEQYGKFSVAFSWMTIFACFMGFQTKEALATGIRDFKNDYFHFRNCTLLLHLGISTILLAICMVFSKGIGRFLGYTPLFLFVIILTAFMQSTWAFAQNSFIFEKRAQRNLILSVSLVASIVGLSVFFIHVVPYEKYIGRMLGFAVPYTAFATGCTAALLCRHSTLIQRTYWKYSLAFGFPMIFHTLSTVILAQSDKVMLRQFQVADSSIGMYSWYFGLVNALLMVKEALNVSWRPFYYDWLSEKECRILKEKCRNHIEIFTAVTSIFMLVVREVSLVMAGKGFQQEISVLPILVSGAYFTFIYQFPVNFELYYKKTKIIAAGTMSAAIVNILLNAVAIPKWGVHGAAAATAMAYLLLAITHFMIASHLTGIIYHLNPAAFAVPILTIVISIILFFLLKDLWILRWMFAAVLCLAEGTKLFKRRSAF